MQEQIMNQLQEYRAKLIDRLEAITAEFCAACRAIGDPYMAVEEGGWNPHQLAAHVRDVDKVVYGQRIRRTIGEDNPEFQNFDADEWMASHYDADEPLASILDKLSASIKEAASMLRNLPREAWSRESCHEVYGGGFMLQTWVERGLAHIKEHLETVKRAK
jgi:DinB superfamily